MTNSPLVLDAHEKSAHAVHFTRDGKHLVTAGHDGVVRVWSVPRFERERELTGHGRAVTGFAFDAAEKRLVTSGAEPAVKVWDFRAGTCERTLEKQALGAVGPDGQHVVTVSARGELVLWDGDTGAQRRTFPPLDKRHLALAFASSGLFLFVGGTGPIHRLALPDGTSDGQHVGHQIGIACLRPSPNPAILGSTGLDGTLRFWTVVGGAEVNCVPLKGQGSFQLAFAPDGRSVAVAMDHAVHWLSAPDGDLRDRFDLPVKAVHGVAFAPDGKRLACAAGDGRVRVWEL